MRPASRLLRTISGVQPLTAGRILFDGQSIERMPAHARVGLGIAQSPEGRQVFGPLSVEDNLRLGVFRKQDAGLGDRLAQAYAMFPILLVEQNASAAVAVANRGYVLETGKMVHQGSGQSLLADPKMRAAHLGL